MCPYEDIYSADRLLLFSEWQNFYNFPADGYDISVPEQKMYRPKDLY